MKLPRPVVRLVNAITNAAIIAGVPRPPYTWKNALVIETFGRRSGKRHRIPVGEALTHRLRRYRNASAGGNSQPPQVISAASSKDLGATNPAGTWIPIESRSKATKADNALAIRP